MDQVRKGSTDSKKWRMANKEGFRPTSFISTSTPAQNQYDSGYFDSLQLFRQTTFDPTKNAFMCSFGESGEIPDKASLLGKSHLQSSDCVGQQEQPQSISSVFNSKFLTRNSSQYSELFSDILTTPSTDSLYCTNDDSIPDCEMSVPGNIYLKQNNSFLTGELSVSVRNKSGVNSFSDIERPLNTNASEEHIHKDMKDSFNGPEFIAENDTLNSGSYYDQRKRGLSDSFSSFQNFDYALQLNPGQSSSSSCGIQEENQKKTQFSVSPSISKSQKFSYATHKSSKCKKVGAKYIDFIKELLKTNCKNVLKTLFSFFTSRELCHISWVSRPWRKAVTSDRLVNQRRQAYIKCRKIIRTGPNKENLKSSKKPPLRSNRQALADRQNIYHQTLSISQNAARTTSTPKSKFQQCIEEVKGLKENEGMRMCPLCISPCKVTVNEHRGKCNTPSCNYEFCTKCFCTYHKSPRCPVSSIGSTPKMPIISSRRSKRNLRRL